MESASNVMASHPQLAGFGDLREKKALLSVNERAIVTEATAAADMNLCFSAPLCCDALLRTAVPTSTNSVFLFMMLSSLKVDAYIVWMWMTFDALPLR